MTCGKKFKIQKVYYIHRMESKYYVHFLSSLYTHCETVFLLFDLDIKVA